VGTSLTWPTSVKLICFSSFFQSGLPDLQYVFNALILHDHPYFKSVSMK
jgi:hypothetical protein